MDEDEGWVTWVGVVGKVGGRGASVEYCGEYCPLGSGNPPDRHEQPGTPWTLWTTTTIDSILPNHEICITHIIVLGEDEKSAEAQQQQPQPQLKRSRQHQQPPQTRAVQQQKRSQQQQQLLQTRPQHQQPQVLSRQQQQLPQKQLPLQPTAGQQPPDAPQSTTQHHQQGTEHPQQQQRPSLLSAPAPDIDWNRVMMQQQQQQQQQRPTVATAPIEATAPDFADELDEMDADGDSDADDNSDGRPSEGAAQTGGPAARPPSRTRRPSPHRVLVAAASGARLEVVDDDHQIRPLLLRLSAPWRMAMKACQRRANEERGRQAKAATSTVAWLCAARCGDTLKLRRCDVTLTDRKLTVTWARGKTVARRGPYTVHTMVPVAFMPLLNDSMTLAHDPKFAFFH